jgi:hypothetical protein
MTKPFENMRWVLVCGDSVYHFDSFKNGSLAQLTIGGALMPEFYFESNYKEINPPKKEYIHIQEA